MKMPMPTPMPTPTTASGHLRRAETRDLFALPPVSNTVNLGPLPTDFVPPRSCADWHMLRIDTFTDNGQKRSAIQYQLDIATAPACMPSSYADVYSKGSAPVFSTGKACPTGFQPACTMVGGDGGFNIGLSKWDALQPSETAIGCCQTGFSCEKHPERRYLCVSTATLGQVIHTSSVVDSTSTQTQPLTINPTLAATAYAMQLIYIGSTGPLLADTVTPPPSIVTATTKPSATASSSSSDDGLSTGTKAAIGIGVAMGVLLLIAAGWIISRRCVKRKRKEYSIREESIFLRTGNESGAVSRASGRRLTEAEWVALNSKEASLKDNNSKKDWPLYGKPFDTSGHVEVPGHDIPVELPAVVPSSWANKALPTVPVIPESPSKEEG